MSLPTFLLCFHSFPHKKINDRVMDTINRKSFKFSMIIDYYLIDHSRTVCLSN